MERVPHYPGKPSVTWFDTELETETSLAPDFRCFLEGLNSADSLVGDSAVGNHDPVRRSKTSIAQSLKVLPWESARDNCRRWGR
jgi:hypothetical protein